MNQEKLQKFLDSEQPKDDIYERFSEAEDMEDYKMDGYHPVNIGERYNNGKYQIVQKLGWGHFSTVWLVQNLEDQKYYALKIQKSKESYQESAEDELKLLSDIQKKIVEEKWKNIVKEIQESQKDIKVEFYHINGLSENENYCADLVDNFIHFGMHGKHYCTVFKLVGPNLLDLINYFDERNRYMDIELVKQITKQILVGLIYMHEVCDIIHTDIKPENIMIQFNEKNYDSFIHKLVDYKKLPLSMKFLQLLREGNSQNKKKNKKKKKKAAQQQEQENAEEEEETKNEDGEEENQEKNNIQEKKENQEIQEEQKQENEKIQEIKEQKNQNEQNQNNMEKNQQNKEQKNEEEEHEDGDWESQGTKEDDNNLIWKNDIIIPLNNGIKVQIVDFGNATWHSDHFTDNIQTREYRSPEAIIKSEYEHNTDVYSLGCLVFELLTNNFLFKPKPGEGYKKNDHHICMITETLGKWPKNFALSGKRSKEFFNKSGNPLKLKDTEPDCEPIHKILNEEFDFSLQDSYEIEEFLVPMLAIDPKKRVSAREALKHPWLWN